MIKKFKNFIVTLQNSDETTKKKWLVVLSGAAMVIVIALWAVYFNLIFPKTETVTAANDASASGSVRESFKNIKEALQNGLRAVKDKSQNTFIISGHE